MNILSELHTPEHVAIQASTRATGLSQYLKYHPLNVVDQKLKFNAVKELQSRFIRNVTNRNYERFNAKPLN